MTVPQKWTLLRVTALARKYQTPRQFELGNRLAYKAACYHGWLPVVTQHMHGRRKHSLQSLKKAARPFNTRASFEKGDSAAYKAAQRTGCLDAVCGHMRPAVVPWTKERTAAEARKCQSRAEFKRRNGSAYNAALRNGWIGKVCAHMRPPLRRWSDQQIVDEGRRYATRGAFRRGSPSAYTLALKRELLEEACRHMKPVRRTWTKTEVLREAKKYDHLEDFIIYARVAYKHALRNDYLDEVCTHAPRINTRWTDESALAEAQQYTVLGDFRTAALGAVKYLGDKGLLRKACAHMLPAKSGYNPNKPGIVYVLAIETPGRERFVKFGITNRRARRRLKGFRPKSQLKFRVLAELEFDDGFDAQSFEYQLLREHRTNQYEGPALLGNGNSEIVWLPVSIVMASVRLLQKQFEIRTGVSPTWLSQDRATERVSRAQAVSRRASAPDAVVSPRRRRRRTANGRASQLPAGARSRASNDGSSIRLSGPYEATASKVSV